ncbi:MAG: hypothetical protein JSS02_08915, partial [Planctomycetes bacterium]|nr:hypothetical protein [Planctomycetota bacterium]
IFAVAAVVLLGAVATQAGEIDFIEDFVLAPDRAVPLKQLIPGTEPYYYYHCLHFQNTEQFDKVEEMLTAWVQRLGEQGRVWEIRTRQALLTYEKNPQKSLEYLRNRMGLQFNHQQEVLGKEPDLPTAFDQAQISRQRLFERAAPHVDDLGQFEDSALEWLAGEKLSPLRRRQLLQRLPRPDVTGLPGMVVADLNFKDSAGFGSLPIHKQLTLAQLDECLKLKPDLLNQGHFVEAMLLKLQPAPDDDWRHDSRLLAANLDRLWAFVQKLAPAHNALKAHVLYHRLVLDRQLGKYDRERFLTYLKLPRPMPYVAQKFLEREEVRRFMADLNANFAPLTSLPAVGNDEEVVRSYLASYFVEATGYAEFEPYIRDDYLKHLFAETKIVNGLGEPEQWASQLPPELFQQLKQRVDIDFAFTNAQTFKAEEPVRLDLFTKNVGTLIVKVFEINTANYYRQQLQEVNTDINLDGLVANEEQTFTYNEPALRRMARHFEFPKLNKTGVYVIDFIGNGRSSRALVRKGRLRQVVRTGPAGQVFTVLDEQNAVVKEASIWLGGRDYRADKDGQITVPFSTAPGRQPIVLQQGDFACLDHFEHLGEAYQLQAGIYVDRESLLQRKKAEVVVRPSLTLNGRQVSLKLLEEVKLVITSTDHSGVATSVEAANFALSEDQETVHEFQVPARLAAISFSLQGKVKNLSLGGQKQDLAVAETVTLNEIDKTERITDLHLAKFGGQYVLEVLGRTGEAKPSRPVQVTLKHRDFKDVVHATLKSDARGRVVLGPLADIVSLTVSGPEVQEHTWSLVGDRHTYPQSLHGRVGEVLTLPFLPKNPAAAGDLRGEVSLLELRGSTYVADRLKHVSVDRGLLEIKDLPAGDYELTLKSSQTRVVVRVAPGATVRGYVLGPQRQLEVRPLAPPQIESIDVQAEQVTIRLRNVSRWTRVHLWGTRYVPAYSVFEHFAKVQGAEANWFVPGRAESAYLTGRNIGDEYRYIIDRKYARKFPGNSLERPSLLLNPWVVQSTETGNQQAQTGDRFGAAGDVAAGMAAGGGLAGRSSVAPPMGFANLDFLSQGAAVVPNLVPDKNGVITLKRAALGAHQHIHVVAVDPYTTTYRSVTLPEPESAFHDLRLLTGLDPKQHFTQQKLVSVVPGRQPFVLPDITTSKFEAYDSLARVYKLFTTLTHDPKLAEFGFVLNWPQLKPAEKQALYSQHASHELNFFLAKKDPEFFQQVIRTYLANKKDKTFLDHWLLEDDLRAYLLPWNHGRLNTVEQILLAQRIEGERAATARHVADQLSLLPPQVEQTIHLFDTAVKGSALDASDEFGVRDATAKEMPVEELRQSLRRVENKPQAADAPAPAPAPAAEFDSAGGLGGGGRGGAMPLAKKKAADRAKQLSEATAGKALARKDAVDKSARFRQERARDELEAKARPEASNESMGWEDDLGLRDESRALYRKLDKTLEWAENNYHHLVIQQQVAGLVPVSAFWRDYAQHAPGQPFYSKHLASAARNFPEMLLALAVLDLPFTAEKHESKFDGVQMTLTPGSAMVVYHEEIRPAKPAAAPVPILVSQNFFKQGDRQRQENGETVDKYVTDEFVIHTVYGCQVVVTNPTSARQRLSVLLQIPNGAIPVLNGEFTRTVHLTLEPYHTQTLDYHFYFPAAGDFTHYPVHVARNEELIAFAPPLTCHVVDKPSKLDTESWDYVSQFGTEDEVIKFLETHNIQGLNLEKVAFRVREAKFFERVTKLLSQRHVYQHTLWSYALMHNVAPAVREFLQAADGIVNEVGGRITSPLLTVDPVARHAYEHLEYKPLVNARVHALGQRRQIVNNRFFEQYHRLLKQLGYQRNLGDDDLLAVTYYLLLQDRIEEAQGTFAKVNVNKLATRLQYDYFTAYFDFFTGDPQRARAIATQYAEYPVDRWRAAFAAITAQLDEAAGQGAKVADEKDRQQQQTRLAATEPNFDFQVEARQVTLNFQNLESVRVNYYLMDVELLFSRNPFVQQFSGQFSSIRPNHSATVALKPAGEAGKPAGGTMQIPLPAELQNKNVLVEITGGGRTKTQAYYSHSLSVQVIENYGQVRVVHAQTAKPVTKAYVKVYAQLPGGEVRFYKDGYTDIRGRFDYSSLNTNEIDAVQKFSVLILSEEFGAVVREAQPPKQ